MITDPELSKRDPLDCEALGSVASGTSMLLVLVEPNPAILGVSALGGPDLGCPVDSGNESSICELETKAEGIGRLAVASSGNSVPGLFDSCANASGANLLGFAGSDSDRVDLTRSDNVTVGVFNCSGIV